VVQLAFDVTQKDVHLTYTVRGVNPDRFAAIERHAGNTVLDVGCGSGAYVLKLKEKLNIQGVDHAQFPSWSQAPELFQVGEATDLSMFKDESFDTLLSFETLEHLPDPNVALKEYYRVAKKNLIITVPNCEVPKVFTDSNLIFSHWNDRTHVQFFTRETIIAAVEDAGFKVTEFKYINRVRVEALVSNLLGGPGIFKRILRKTVLAGIKQDHFITLLVVAAKS